MARVERRVKDFELTGPVTFLRADTSPKNGQRYVILSVAGISFFLPPELHAEANYIDEWQIITVRGEYAGDQVRNGQRQPSFEIYEIVRMPETSSLGVGALHSNGVNGKLEKGAPA